MVVWFLSEACSSIFFSILSMSPFMCGLSMLGSVLCVVAMLSSMWSVVYGYILIIVSASGVLGLLIYICALCHSNFEVLYGSKFTFMVLSWCTAFLFYELGSNLGVTSVSTIYHSNNLYTFGVIILFLCVLLFSVLVLVQVNSPSRKA
uniref:NADH dehydrogenase subunit 6 n=1 Tax=Plectus aquatilis TaxID=70222 RepID=A0A1U7AFS5_9BILA|nr:NADH dehydrogenase subunit 6 [Plectus aquatilis]